MPKFIMKSWIFLKKGFPGRPAHRGFTLVESLVAIAILGVSAAAFISDLSNGSLAVQTLDEQVTSQNLLQTQMEQIKAAAYDSSGNSYTMIAAPAGYTMSVAVNSQIYSDNYIQKITLTVYHNGNPSGTLDNYKVDR